MKYKVTDDKYLQEMNRIAEEANLYSSTNSIYRIIPQGNNALPTKNLYYQRLNYEIQFDYVSISQNLKPEKFKDFLYLQQMYGKINLSNDVVNVDNSQLKGLNEDPKLMLIAPAADAFNALFARHKNLINSNGIPQNSKFSEIKPKKAYISPNDQHYAYLNVYFNKFYNFINNNKLNNKIVDFKSFIKYFVFFYNQNDKIINKTEFIKTSLCSPYASGLVVDIAVDRHGNDLNAYTNYLRDDSYGLFDTLVKQYGFVMDKHSPWRLTFDIAGANAQSYLRAYNVQDLTQYFNKFYYFTEYFNFETLKISLLNLYNLIAQEQPYARIVNTVFMNGKACINERQILRQYIRYEDLYNNMSEEDFLKLYFYTKVKENNIIKTDSEFDQLFGEISVVNKYSGNIAAFDYINEKCKNMKDSGNIEYTRTFF